MRRKKVEKITRNNKFLLTIFFLIVSFSWHLVSFTEANDDCYECSPQCVDYVKGKLPYNSRWKRLSVGEAKNWWDLATKQEKGSEPKTGAVMIFDQWGKNYAGHVALVLNVSGNNITVTHSNFHCYCTVSTETFILSGDNKIATLKGTNRTYPVLGFVYTSFSDQTTTKVPIPQPTQPQKIVQPQVPTVQPKPQSPATGTQSSQTQPAATSGLTKTVANTGGYGINLRSSPGINSTVIAKLTDGTKVTVIGSPRSADGYIWWNVSASNGTGWSAVGDWLTPAPVVGSMVTVTNTGVFGLKLRKNPCVNDAQCPKITTLSDGTQLKVIGGPLQADGFTWWQINGTQWTGWSAVGNWLVPNPRY